MFIQIFIEDILQFTEVYLSVKVSSSNFQHHKDLFIRITIARVIFSITFT